MELSERLNILKHKSAVLIDLLRDPLLPYTAHDVQHRTSSDRVRSPMAQRRAQITQIRFVEKSNEK